MDEVVVDPSLLNGRDGATRWMNLGWWERTTRYPEAAAALARQVGRAAGLRTGDQVLDVGCGAGDSPALWVREFGVAGVTAVEPNPTLATTARDRIDRWGLGGRITVQARTAESVTARDGIERMDAVVAVDVAYHIRTRARWLQRLGAITRPGTRFGSFDIALRHAEDRARVVRQAHRAGIPIENLWTVDEIVPTLTSAGFTQVTIRHAEAEVFAGFVHFARRQAVRLAAHPRRGGWRALGTALLLATAAQRLSAVVIGAQRGEGSPSGHSDTFDISAT